MYWNAYRYHLFATTVVRVIRCHQLLVCRRTSIVTDIREEYVLRFDADVCHTLFVDTARGLLLVKQT